MLVVGDEEPASAPPRSSEKSDPTVSRNGAGRVEAGRYLIEHSARRRGRPSVSSPSSPRSKALRTRASRSPSGCHRAGVERRPGGEGVGRPGGHRSRRGYRPGRVREVEELATAESLGSIGRSRAGTSPLAASSSARRCANAFDRPTVVALDRDDELIERGKIVEISRRAGRTFPGGRRSRPEVGTRGGGTL